MDSARPAVKRRVIEQNVDSPAQTGGGGLYTISGTGANPRDTEADTVRNRGIDMADCRKMLYEAGFMVLRCGDDSTVLLELRCGEVAKKRSGDA
jgi:hypothetical protein